MGNLAKVSFVCDLTRVFLVPISSTERLTKMKVLFCLAILVACVYGDLIGKTCKVHTDCEANECCGKIFLLGDRCRSKLSEGSICDTFVGNIVDRLHRRCGCDTGLKCTHTNTIGGLYKIYRCKKPQ